MFVRRRICVDWFTSPPYVSGILDQHVTCIAHRSEDLHFTIVMPILALCFRSTFAQEDFDFFS
jgi:hypothetical protein